MLITVKSIIDEMLLTESNPDSWYAAYLTHALNGVRELTYDIIATAKTKYLPIESNNVVYWPADYVNFCKLGVVDANGQIQAIGWNPKIALIDNKDNCGGDVARKATGEQRGIWFENYTDENGETGAVFGQVMFGLGGGQNPNGYYRVDKNNRCFVFSSEVNVSHIVLEYVTNGVADKGKTMIHEWAKQSLIGWIRWQHSVARKESISEQKSLKQDYEGHLRTLRKRKFSFTISQFKGVWRRYNHQSYKL